MMKENVSERNATRNSVPDAKKIVTQKGRKIGWRLQPQEKPLASPNGAGTFGGICSPHPVAVLCFTVAGR